MTYLLRSTSVRLLFSTLFFFLLSSCGGSGSGDAGTTDMTATPTAPLQLASTITSSAAISRPRPTLPIPSPLVGVTMDSTSNLAAAILSLQSISKVPTTRIVFDEFVPANSYVAAATQIRNVSYVMGEILDSFYVKQYSVQAYLARTSEYLAALGAQVDIWEVGNEINGEWLGNNADVVAKMSGAFDLVKAQGKISELTLYYNKGCFSKSSNEMFTWAQNNVPDRMKQGLDYVLISYYEDDCNGAQPNWSQVFTQLHAMFPNSKIGFGETGTTSTAKKAAYITRYYSTQITTPGYVGGYFWWYFLKDMVPNTKPLLATLNSAINTVPTPPPPPPPTTSTIPLTSGYWTTAYNGYGSVTYDATAGITMAPMAATAASETHAALTLANNSMARNFQLSITATTLQQLRLNSTPNTWETLWIFFNYVPTATDKNTNYFVLKTNGIELGTAYAETGQTFLQTASTTAKALNVSNRYDIVKIGNHVTVSINGQKVTDFTGAIIDVPGSIGLYTEDARVNISNVQFTALP